MFSVAEGFIISCNLCSVQLLSYRSRSDFSSRCTKSGGSLFSLAKSTRRGSLFTHLVARRIRAVPWPENWLDFLNIRPILHSSILSSFYAQILHEIWLQRSGVYTINLKLSFLTNKTHFLPKIFQVFQCLYLGIHTQKNQFKKNIYLQIAKICICFRTVGWIFDAGVFFLETIREKPISSGVLHFAQTTIRDSNRESSAPNPANEQADVIDSQMWQPNGESIFLLSLSLSFACARTHKAGGDAGKLSRGGYATGAAQPTIRSPNLLTARLRLLTEWSSKMLEFYPIGGSEPFCYSVRSP